MYTTGSGVYTTGSGVYTTGSGVYTTGSGVYTTGSGVYTTGSGVYTIAESRKAVINRFKQKIFMKIKLTAMLAKFVLLFITVNAIKLSLTIQL